MKIDCLCLCISASLVTQDAGSDTHVEYILRPIKNSEEGWLVGDQIIASPKTGIYVPGQEYKLTSNAE